MHIHNITSLHLILRTESAVTTYFLNPDSYFQTISIYIKKVNDQSSKNTPTQFILTASILKYELFLSRHSSIQ